MPNYSKWHQCDTSTHDILIYAGFYHVKDSKKHPYNNPQTTQLVCRNDPVGLSEQSNWVVITPQLDCRAWTDRLLSDMGCAKLWLKPFSY